MKITIEIDDEIIRRAVESANIGYWANIGHAGHEWDRHSMRLVLHEFEDDDPDPHVPWASDFANGVRVLAEKYPHHFADLIGQQGDMYTGDALVQCACFGELKYG